MGKIELRRATWADGERLLSWRNDGATRRASRNTELVAPADHLDWLARVLSHAGHRLYLAEEDGSPVATVRAHRREAGWELSWTVAPEARGRGVAKAAVAALAQRIADPLYAEVKPDNPASARVAEFAGLTRVETGAEMALYHRGATGEGRGQWEPVTGFTDLPAPREYPAMVSLEPGRVMMFGGHDREFFNDTWIFDTARFDWEKISCPHPPETRRLHAMATLGSGDVLLFGGQNGEGLRNDTWLGNPGAGLWTPLACGSAVPSPRLGACLVPLGNGRALLFGGFDGQRYLGDSWIFDLGMESWRQIESPLSPLARGHHAMAGLDKGRVILHGGVNQGVGLGDTWCFEEEGGWQVVETDLAPGARRYHSLVSCSADKLLLYGGFDGKNQGDTWRFDGENLQWVQESAHCAMRDSHGHALGDLGQGRVLLFGGNRSLREGENLGDTWVYQPPAAEIPLQ